MKESEKVREGEDKEDKTLREEFIDDRRREVKSRQTEEGERKIRRREGV